MINFSERLEQSTCIGVFSKVLDSAFVEAAGLAGLDFIILDQEHGPVSLERLHDHVRAARLTNMAPIIRVKGLDHMQSGQPSTQVQLAFRCPISPL